LSCWLIYLSQEISIFYPIHYTTVLSQLSTVSRLSGCSQFFSKAFRSGVSFSDN